MKWEVKYTVDAFVGGKTEHAMIIDAKGIREAARFAHAAVVRPLKQQPGIRDVIIRSLRMWEPA